MFSARKWSGVSLVNEAKIMIVRDKSISTSRGRCFDVEAREAVQNVDLEATGSCEISEVADGLFQMGFGVVRRVGQIVKMTSGGTLNIRISDEVIATERRVGLIWAWIEGRKRHDGERF